MKFFIHRDYLSKSQCPLNRCILGFEFLNIEASPFKNNYGIKNHIDCEGKSLYVELDTELRIRKMQVYIYRAFVNVLNRLMAWL